MESQVWKKSLEGDREGGNRKKEGIKMVNVEEEENRKIKTNLGENVRERREACTS